jgi:hypothetical protein
VPALIFALQELDVHATFIKRGVHALIAESVHLLAGLSMRSELFQRMRQKCRCIVVC